jgi:membrane protease YdiL (CAAX protease family)
VFAALLLAYLFSFNSNQFLLLDQYPGTKFSIAAVMLVLVIFPVVNLIAALNSEIQLPEFLGGVERYLNEQDRMNEQIMETFLADTNLRGLFINIVMIGIIPAVGEELFFRGVVQNIFSRMTRNHHWGIWITAAIFSLIHMQFSGFFPRVFLGAMFGYLLVWSRSMWVPILAHFINNLASVIMYYFVNTGKLARETLEFGSTMDVLPFVLVSAVLSGALLWYFYKNAVKTTGYPADIKDNQEH